MVGLEEVVELGSLHHHRVGDSDQGYRIAILHASKANVSYHDLGVWVCAHQQDTNVVSP